MQWWTEFLNWLASSNGERIVTTAIVPFVAIVVAGIVAALIGRAAARKVIELSERAVRTSAVTALISAARKAAVWNSLAAPEQQHVDHLISDSDIRLRLLPVAGTSMAADWAAHEIAGMKRNAVSFSFQAEQSLLIFRDRLVEWQSRPGRAKKLFKNDLEAWAYDSSVTEQELVHQQQAWAASQVSESTERVTTPARSVDTRATTPAASPAGAAAATAPGAAATSSVAAPVNAPVTSAVNSAVNIPTRAPMDSLINSPATDPDESAVPNRTQQASVFPLANLVEPERASTRNNHPVLADEDDDSGDEPTSYLALSEDETDHYDEQSTAPGSKTDAATNASVNEATADAVDDSAGTAATAAEDDLPASTQHDQHDEGR